MDVLTTALKWAVSFSLMFFTFMYLAGPLLVWRLQRSPASFHFSRIDDPDFLEKRTAEFQAMHAALQSLGFSYAGSSSMAMSHSQTFFSLYRDNNGMLASLVTAKGGSRELTYTEFTQHHADDSVTNVSNLAFIGVFPPSRHKRSFRFPHIHDLKELLEAARSITRHLPVESSPRPFPVGKEFPAIEKFLLREANELVEKGWYAAGVVEGYRRLTLKGACLMTWRLLWPARPLINHAEKKQARQALLRARQAESGNITSQN